MIELLDPPDHSRLISGRRKIQPKPVALLNASSVLWYLSGSHLTPCHNVPSVMRTTLIAANPRRFPLRKPFRLRDRRSCATTAVMATTALVPHRMTPKPMRPDQAENLG